MKPNHDLISEHEGHNTDRLAGLACNATAAAMEEFARCEATRINAMTLEEVEAELRCRGIDPDRALERIQRCMEDVQCCGDERRR